MQRHPIQNDVTMFITTNTKNRAPVFANPAYAREAAEHIYRVQERIPFLLFGFVIMPDHVHLLLHVRAPRKISTVINTYKTGLTFQLGIGAFWQHRFDLRISNNVAATLRYIHENPRKAGIVDRSIDYPWSSACGSWEISMFA
jgi:putative transposase